MSETIRYSDSIDPSKAELAVTGGGNNPVLIWVTVIDMDGTEQRRIEYAANVGQAADLVDAVQIILNSWTDKGIDQVYGDTFRNVLDASRGYLTYTAMVGDASYMRPIGTTLFA